jgi:hypothetical protein
MVPVSRKRSDKRPNGLIAEGFLSLHEQARNLKHYVVCVVGQNAFLVRSCPCNPPSLGRESPGPEQGKAAP